MYSTWVQHCNLMNTLCIQIGYDLLCDTYAGVTMHCEYANDRFWVKIPTNGGISAARVALRI